MGTAIIAPNSAYRCENSKIPITNCETAMVIANKANLYGASSASKLHRPY